MASRNSSDAERDPALYSDYWKQTLEYLKYVVTLSTGAIGIIASLLEKLFTAPLWKWAVVSAVLGFMVAVVGAMTMYTLFLVHERPENREVDAPDWVKIVGGTSALAMWAGFLIGVLSLGVFAIKNLL